MARAKKHVGAVRNVPVDNYNSKTFNRWIGYLLVAAIGVGYYWVFIGT